MSMQCQRQRDRDRGLALIELMIAMLLGLVVIGGAVGLLLANRQNYRTNEGLSQIQESARTAFELLARDVRQAAANGCGNNGRVANVLKAGANWWQTWFGLTGYDDAQTDPAVAFGAAVGDRANGTDSLQLQGIEGTGLAIENHDPVSANFKINATTTDFADSDILMVCDFDHAAILQVTSYNSSNVTVVHNVGVGVETPGNCSKGLGFPTICTTNGNEYAFKPNSQIARFAAVDWYIGNNGRAAEGGRSLYRRRLATAATVAVEEIVAGVVNMQIQYRLNGTAAFVDADAVGTGDWLNVDAVSIALTLDSADQRVSTAPTANSGRLQRTFNHVVTLRNRVP